MSLRLVLLRHAETDWNRERRYQGVLDIGLSETGRAQAVSAARLLAPRPFAAVVSSPLSRARSTAEAIAAGRGLTVRVDDAFSEMGFGTWEGLTIDEVRAQFPDAARAFRETPHATRVPGGESLDEVRDRALRGLARLRAEHEGETVCVVSHGVTARVLILEALGLGLDRVWSLHVSPTGISELEFRDDWSAVHRMNSLVHLDGLPAAGRG